MLVVVWSCTRRHRISMHCVRVYEEMHTKAHVATVAHGGRVCNVSSAVEHHDSADFERWLGALEQEDSLFPTIEPSDWLP